MKAIIYTRISTDDSKQNIKQQRDYCKEYCIRNNYEVEHIIGDKESGKIPIRERSGGKRLLAFLENDPSLILVVQDIDRLCRNFYDAVWFEQFVLKHHIIIKSISETIDLSNPMGKFTFRIKMAMNAFYVENLHQKIKVGVERAKREGKFKGRKKGSKNKKN